MSLLSWYQPAPGVPYSSARYAQLWRGRQCIFGKVAGPTWPSSSDRFVLDQKCHQFSRNTPIVLQPPPLLLHKITGHNRGYSPHLPESARWYRWSLWGPYHVMNTWGWKRRRCRARWSRRWIIWRRLPRHSINVPPFPIPPVHHSITFCATPARHSRALSPNLYAFLYYAYSISLMLVD